ncbi:uncharacterized protein LOC105845806 [Hydra vulgaris]|uniref:uncharacterized protein LOC105845806 n=1 Tax=Hydra vulgaris TaxID=6087 RepID=UPI00064153B9|nr:uncharacterized protein LOC105845806 [Hydra vulgaris]
MARFVLIFLLPCLCAVRQSDIIDKILEDLESLYVTEKNEPSDNLSQYSHIEKDLTDETSYHRELIDNDVLNFLKERADAENTETLNLFDTLNLENWENDVNNKIIKKTKLRENQNEKNELKNLFWQHYGNDILRKEPSNEEIASKLQKQTLNSEILKTLSPELAQKLLQQILDLIEKQNNKRR